MQLGSCIGQVELWSKQPACYDIELNWAMSNQRCQWLACRHVGHSVCQCHAYTQSQPPQTLPLYCEP